MAKSFKKIRSGWDDEWSDYDDDVASKEARFSRRRDKRQKKESERFVDMEDDSNE